MGRARFGSAAAFTTLVALAGACGSGSSSPDEGSDAGTPGLDAAFVPTPVDGGVPDTTPPRDVADLAAEALTHTSIRLTWSAPDDEGQPAAGYEIRYATTPIATEADFTAATAATAPSPATPGTKEQLDLAGLTPETTYHVALRSRDAAGNASAIATATVATKARATFLVSEIAVANTLAQGADFVELVATKGGWADAIELRQSAGSIYKLAPFDVATGERVVVHLTNVPGPAGYAQEDVTVNKAQSTAPFAAADAWDVYSTKTSVASTDNVLEVLDGAAVQDAVALSNRDGDVAAGTMTDFAAARTAGAWSFSAAPVDTVNDCAIQAEAVNTAAADTTCGGFPSGLADGVTLNRKGTTDTNTKKDFYVAAQTPGAVNGTPPAPKVVSAASTSATGAEVRFDQEIDAGTVTQASFTIGGLAVSAASVVGPNRVALTTDPQSDGGYTVTAGAAVAASTGAVVDPANKTARFCGFSAAGAALALTEINPQADVIELTVTQGGPLAGFSVRRDPRAGSLSGTLLATLPAICAIAGDVVVVHLNPGMGAPSETLAKNEAPVAMYATYYDTAWDVASSNANTLPYATSLVVAVRDPAGTYVEAAAFSRNTAAESTTYDQALQYVQGLALWTPADCGGAVCSDATTPKGREIAATWDATSPTAGGDSCRRSSPTSAKSAASWSVGPSSFGQ